MSIFGGIVTILGKIADQIQGRIERLKNELDALEKERNEILKNKATVKAAQRLIVISKRIEYLRGVLINKE
jgi:hypothetical protein